MKIYLVGMPGSGKSTLGRPLASSLLTEYVDLDEEIEKREGKPVQSIFSENGEDYFRQLESKVLKEWAASTGSFVMATGGGTPCFYDGIDVMNQTGMSIFLRASLATLVSRLKNKTDRPLLNASDVAEKKARINELLEARLACYERATITVDNADLSKLEAVLHLRK